MKSKEILSPFQDLTDQQLGALWDEADDTPGERAKGFAKGEIWQEIARRADSSITTEPKLPIATGSNHRSQRTSFRPIYGSHHPIYGSRLMREQNKRDAIRTRSKR